MTLPNVASTAVVYISSGTRGPFAFQSGGSAIRITSASFLRVTRYVGPTADTGTLLVEGSDYTVAGLPDAPTVTLTSSQPVLASPQRLVVERVQPFAQDLDITVGGSFPAEAVEARLDKITEYTQDLRTAVNRAVTAHPFDAGRDITLPPAQVGRVLGWGPGPSLVNLPNGAGDDSGPFNIVHRFVATAGQTVALLPYTYTVAVDALEVYVNGLRLDVGLDYAETSSTSITFLTPLSSGAEVIVAQVSPGIPLVVGGGLIAGVVYVRKNGNDNADGRSIAAAVQTISRGLQIANGLGPGHVVSVYPGSYTEQGSMVVGPGVGVVSVGGQYTTDVVAAAGYESANMFLLSSGSYVQGFSFRNQQVDSFDNPTGGFAIAFAPNATIFRSPYVRDISQVSQYQDKQVVEPLGPEYPETITIAGAALGGTTPANNIIITVATVSGTGGVLTFTFSGTAAAGTQTYTAVTGTASKFGTGAQFTVTRTGGAYTVTVTTAGSGYYAQPNPIVPRGGGTILADRAVLNVNSVFPYILAFGATPRSPNGIGYCAKNGAGINGISSITIFQRIAFYALNGGQITLNNSGTQFGDVSFRSRGSTQVAVAATTGAALAISTAAAAAIVTNKQAVIDAMWAAMVTAGLTVGQPASYEQFTRRDAGNLLDSLRFDFLDGDKKVTQAFALGFFDYNAALVFNYGALGADFQFAFDAIKTALYAYAPFDVAGAPRTMLNGLVQIVKDTLDPATRPASLTFPSLIESLAHQFNNAGAGVNANALPLNFRRPGSNQPVPFTILQELGGRVRWSGADELNNQYFAGGTKIDGRTGRFEGRPFNSAVRQIARRVANSRGIY